MFCPMRVVPRTGQAGAGDPSERPPPHIAE